MSAIRSYTYSLPEKVSHSYCFSNCLIFKTVDLRNYVLTVAILEFNMAGTGYSKQWSYWISLSWKLVVNRRKCRKCFSVCLNFKVMCNKIMFKEHRVCPMLCYEICYFLLCPTGTEPLSSTVLQIFTSKYIGAMTLTFQGTWRHRSRDRLIPQVAISYRCSTVTESLSPVINEIGLMGHKHIEVTNWPF